MKYHINYCLFIVFVLPIFNSLDELVDFKIKSNDTIIDNLKFKLIKESIYNIGLKESDLIDLNPNEIRISFYSYNTQIRQQVHYELYDYNNKRIISDHTTNGYINVFSDTCSKVVLWNDSYKTIELELNHSTRLEEIRLHFKRATDEAMPQTIHGIVYKDGDENPLEDYIVKIGKELYSPIDSVSTSRGIRTLTIKGSYEFDKLDYFGSKAILIFGARQLTLNTISDDVELDVVLDTDGKILPKK